MTNVLHIPPLPGTPIACDMSSAPDTPNDRLHEYGRLFESALIRRERRADAVVFAFRAETGVWDTVTSLARREAACCPFLDYRVQTVDDEVVWTMGNPVTGEEREGVDVILDAAYALPDHAGATP